MERRDVVEPIPCQPVEHPSVQTSTVLHDATDVFADENPLPVARAVSTHAAAAGGTFRDAAIPRTQLPEDCEAMSVPKAGSRKRYCRWGKGSPCISPIALGRHVANWKEAAVIARPTCREHGVHASVEYKTNTSNGGSQLRGRGTVTETCDVIYQIHVEIFPETCLEARGFGQHCHRIGDTAGHGRVFNVLEMLIAKQYADVTTPGAMTRTGLLNAFRIAKIPSQSLPTDPILDSWIARENLKRRPFVPSQVLTPRVVGMRAAIAPFRVDSVRDVLELTDHRKLCLLNP